MIQLPENLIQLVESFKQLPSVGEKSAIRLVLSLLKWDEHKIMNFAKSLESITKLNSCDSCGFITDSNKCSICDDHKRSESKQICIVESISDLIAIEKSGFFQGTYHVLGGVLNPLLGIGPNELNLTNLVSRVAKEQITEVVLAINPSVEGDATSNYVQEMLGSVNINRIGYGVPMGGSLEYLDPLTISKAFENRKHI